MQRIQTMDMTTTLEKPWALVKRGGDQKGIRPRTRLAYCTSVIMDKHVAVAMRGYIGDGERWTKVPRRIEMRDVVKTWTAKPTPAEIKAERQKMETM